MKFKRKQRTVEATQWFKNGDHPEDKCVLLTASGALDLPKGTTFLSEGRVVRYFRTPFINGESKCINSTPCPHKMSDHGWIDSPGGGFIVCPGDWIITGLLGEYYPLSEYKFKLLYKKIE